MGYVEASARGLWLQPRSRRVLACVDNASLGFLSSHGPLPWNTSAEFFETSEHVFDRLWSDSAEIVTVVIDRCSFDLEELLYASLNHTHVCFVVRSPDLADSVWYGRYARQPNIRLPCSDFMVWVYGFSSAMQL